MSKLSFIFIGVITLNIFSMISASFVRAMCCAPAGPDACGYEDCSREPPPGGPESPPPDQEDDDNDGTRIRRNNPTYPACDGGCNFNCTSVMGWNYGDERDTGTGVYYKGLDSNPSAPYSLPDANFTDDIIGYTPEVTTGNNYLHLGISKTLMSYPFYPEDPLGFIKIVWPVGRPSEQIRSFSHLFIPSDGWYTFGIRGNRATTEPDPDCYYCRNGTADLRCAADGESATTQHTVRYIDLEDGWQWYTGSCATAPAGAIRQALGCKRSCGGFAEAFLAVQNTGVAGNRSTPFTPPTYTGNSLEQRFSTDYNGKWINAASFSPTAVVAANGGNTSSYNDADLWAGWRYFTAGYYPIQISGNWWITTPGRRLNYSKVLHNPQFWWANAGNGNAVGSVTFTAEYVTGTNNADLKSCNLEGALKSCSIWFRDGITQPTMDASGWGTFQLSWSGHTDQATANDVVNLYVVRDIDQPIPDSPPGLRPQVAIVPTPPAQIPATSMVPVRDYEAYLLDQFSSSNGTPTTQRDLTVKLKYDSATNLGNYYFYCNTRNTPTTSPSSATTNCNGFPYCSTNGGTRYTDCTSVSCSDGIAGPNQPGGDNAYVKVLPGATATVKGYAYIRTTADPTCGYVPGDVLLTNPSVRVTAFDTSNQPYTGNTVGGEYQITVPEHTTMFTAGGATGFTSLCTTPQYISDWTGSAPPGPNFIYRANSTPWWQTEGGDVGARGIINNDVPAGYAMSLSNTTMLYGVLAGGIEPELGLGGFIDADAPLKWTIESDYTVGDPYKEDFFYFKDLFNLPDPGISWNDERVDGNKEPEKNVDPASPLPKVFTYNSDFSLGSWVPAAGKDVYIVFINGNLTVDSDFDLDDDDFVAFIVSGDIYFNYNVTKADGIYIAQKQLQVLSAGANLDDQFTGQGVYVGWEGVELDRDLGNDIDPGVKLTYNPALLLHDFEDETNVNPSLQPFLIRSYQQKQINPIHIDETKTTPFD